MKLFGGGGSRKGKPRKKSKKQNEETFVVHTPYDDDPDYDVMGDDYGPDGGSKKGKKGKRKGTALLVVAIIAFILAGTAFAMTRFIKPPDVTTKENDATIVDQENGDVITIDPGERISDYFTFLVCATDIDETRTDNIMVVGFNTKDHTVNVLNIPRDVMCANSKKGANKKINAAYGSKHDIQNTIKEVKKVIGFTPDKYIVVNFNGIAEIVDAIGGVQYDIPFKMIYNDPVQDLNIYFEPGPQTLNGEQVVEFLRWRHNDPGYTHLQTEGYDGGDESRIQKQQEFLKYLANQILKPANILKAKPIAQAVFGNVKTDLTMGELVWMANQAMQVKSENIQMFTLPGYAASSYAGTNAFLSFYFPNESKTLALINQYFNPYDKQITSLDVISSPPDGTRRAGVSSDEDEDEPAPRPDDTDDGGNDAPEQTDPEQNGGSEPDQDPITGDPNGGNPDEPNGNGSDDPNVDPGQPDDVPLDPDLPEDPGTDNNDSNENGGEVTPPPADNVPAEEPSGEGFADPEA